MTKKLFRTIDIILEMVRNAMKQAKMPENYQEMKNEMTQNDMKWAKNCSEQQI